MVWKNEAVNKVLPKNEVSVMKQLGFLPTINSGAGWVQKGR